MTCEGRMSSVPLCQGDLRWGARGWGGAVGEVRATRTRESLDSACARAGSSRRGGDGAKNKVAPGWVTVESVPHVQGEAGDGGIPSPASTLPVLSPFILGLAWLTPAHRTGPCCCLLVGLCPQAAPAETREWEKAQGGCFFHDSAHPRLQAGAACRILPAALSGFPRMTPDPQSRRALAL